MPDPARSEAGSTGAIPGRVMTGQGAPGLRGTGSVGRREGQMAAMTGRVATPYGPAEVVLDRPAGRPRSLLVLGHGAGGGVDAVDLTALAAAAANAGVVVARVTQPYRLAGRRSPPPPTTLDRAWLAAVTAVRELAGGVEPLIVGGRSSGARVACRTAGRLGAASVIALAFPLHPPGRPALSRSAELDSGLPTLVINGDRDPFGGPDPTGTVEVVIRPGERHDLRRDPASVADAAVAWLRRHGWAR